MPFVVGLFVGFILCVIMINAKAVYLIKETENKIKDVYEVKFSGYKIDFLISLNGSSEENEQKIDAEFKKVSNEFKERFLK